MKPATAVTNSKKSARPASPNIQTVDSRLPLVSPQSAQQPLIRHTEPARISPVAVIPAPRTPARTQIQRGARNQNQNSKQAPNNNSRNQQSRLAVKKTIKNNEVSKQRKPELRANGKTREQLISSAYQAISTGKLGEEENLGAIYYIRLLKRIDRGNPQIHRLARKVVSAYHSRARLAIRKKQNQSATQLLWMAGRMIKEFNLVRMNKSHQILKHKLADN